jgi:hypothetical protein
MHIDPGVAGGRRRGEVPRTQADPRFEDALARLDVTPGGANPATGFDCPEGGQVHDDLVAFDGDVFLRHDQIGSGWNDRPGGDSRRVPGL